MASTIVTIKVLKPALSFAEYIQRLYVGSRFAIEHQLDTGQSWPIVENRVAETCVDVLEMRQKRKMRCRHPENTEEGGKGDKCMKN